MSELCVITRLKLNSSQTNLEVKLLFEIDEFYRTGQRLSTLRWLFQKSFEEKMLLAFLSQKCKKCNFAVKGPWNGDHSDDEETKCHGTLPEQESSVQLASLYQLV